MNKGINKILIIRLSSIGDIILTTPVIRILKHHFPASKIDFVIKQQFAELLAHHPAINQLLIFDKSQATAGLKNLKHKITKQRYDLIIDLHKNFRSYFLTLNSGAGCILRYKKFVWRRWLLVKLKWNLFEQPIPIFLRYLIPIKKLGFEYDDLGLDIFFSEKIKFQVEEKFAPFLQQNFHTLIGIAPGASFFTKRWTAEGFEAVIDHFSQQTGMGVILFGNAADRELIDSLHIKNRQQVLNAAGELSLIQTAALMDKCGGVISNDSGLMHLAAALKKNIVAIFGSTTAELGFYPVTTEHIIVENPELKCRPCSHIGRKKCPKHHFACMKKIEPAQVIAAAEKLFLIK